MDDEINLRGYIDVILKRWKIILVFVLVFAGLALFFSSRQQPLYQAKTTILIRSGGGSSSIPSGLAGLAGITLPSQGGSLGDLTEVLQSRVVAAKVVDDLSLRKRIQGWDNPEIEDYKLASYVAGMLKKPESSVSLVKLKVEYTDPKLTAEIANAYIDALAFYWNKLNYTAAQKQRKYIESQLPRLEKDLKKAEQRLKNFTLLSGGSNSQSQGIEVARLSRELEIQNAVYTLLRKEYESVKLEESKEIPPFSVLDKAETPEQPFNIKIKFKVMTGFLSGLFVGIFAAFFVEYWEKSKKNN